MSYKVAVVYNFIEKFEMRQPSLKLLKFLASTGRSQLKRQLQDADKETIDDILYGHDVLSLCQAYAKPLIEKTGFIAALKKIVGRKQYFARYDPEVFLNYLKPLQPRAYSIASSQTKYPNQVHLTVAEVAYQFNRRSHTGACSGYLSHLKVGEKLSCWLLPNRYFALPDEYDKDIIMIGPGTGVAPFVGFLQERQQQKASGQNWLFFGDREKQHDFLYQSSFEQFLEQRVLTQLDTAFSRDQSEKIYVQHKIAAAAQQIFEWLERGAYLYLCGDAKRMAVDVEASLIQLLQQQGNMDLAAAKNYLLSLQKQKRFLKDVY